MFLHFRCKWDVIVSKMSLSSIFQDPLELGNQLGVEHGAKEVQMEFMHGTTTLGFKYQGGVVLAVDSRATGK